VLGEIMRRFVIFITLLFALFTFINAINASTYEKEEWRVEAGE
jgi:hypothetical protein